MRFLIFVISVFSLADAFAETGPRRVVSLGGAVTEIVYGLGKGDLLVGVDSTSTFPAEAGALPDVGYVRALSAEGILAMKPDLILASADAGPPSVIEQLRGAGVKIVFLPKEHSLEEIRGKILAVADALDAREAGEKLASSFDQECRQVESLANSGTALPAVFLMGRGDGALLAAGRGTAADEMLKAAGLRNVIGDYEGYKPVSAESLLGLAPVVIVTGTRTAQAAGGVDRLKQNPALSLTPAVKENRIVVFDDLYLLGFGPRAAKAALELAGTARR